MESPPKPRNEAARLQSLRRYDILDTPSEETFDRISRLARLVAQTPMALVTLVDEKRQWFKACIGVDITETDRDISFCGHAIISETPLVVPDTRQDPRFADNPVVMGDPYIRFYMGVPLKADDGSHIGTLCVLDREPRHLDDAQTEGLRDLAAMVERELALRLSAHTDPLTGALNRRLLHRMIDGEAARMRRNGGRVTVAYVDIDHFKRLNDTYGHDAGDAVLADLTRVIQATIRETDTLFRIGGEEFAVLLVDTGPQDAAEAMERVRQAVAATTMSHEGFGLQVTVSIGIASVPASIDAPMDEVMSRADAALYEAKRQGRNRVEVSVPD